MLNNRELGSLCKGRSFYMMRRLRRNCSLILTNIVSVRIDNFTVKAKPSSGGGSSSPKKDNVVTCQMAGYPSNYAWNEAAKACQAGYLDAGGNFHPYNTVRRSNVPNTSDNGNLTFYVITMVLMTFIAYITAKTLAEDSRG